MVRRVGARHAEVDGATRVSRWVCSRLCWRKVRVRSILRLHQASLVCGSAASNLEVVLDFFEAGQHLRIDGEHGAAHVPLTELSWRLLGSSGRQRIVTPRRCSCSWSPVVTACVGADLVSSRVVE